MCSWHIKIILIASLFLNAQCHAFFQNSTEWRTIYIAPGDDDYSLADCPVDHCFYLQNVFSNSSYFFHSHTTLELLSGVYNITEQVGQLVLTNVNNFKLKGSSSKVTHIACQPGATLGLIVVQSQNVEISNIQISYCSTKLQFEGSISSIAAYDILQEYLEYNLSSCDANANGHPACYAFLASFGSDKLAVYNTVILHSSGIGIFSFDDKALDISKTHLAYNQINCIAFVLDTTNTTLNILQSQIEFGQAKPQSFKLASGLNLFVYVSENTHITHLSNITLTNNRGAYGNFFMSVSVLSWSFYHIDVHVSILISNMSSIQTRRALPGFVTKYNIHLSKYDRSALFDDSKCTGFFPLFDFDCYLWYWPIESDDLWPKSVAIVLQNSYFIGSCVTIRDSELDLSINGARFTFAMKNITIYESVCPVALSIVNSRVKNNVQLSGLTIANSQNDILSVNIMGSHSRLTLTGSTSFLANQGSISVLSGQVEFKDFALISGNIAHKHESIFQVSDSSEIFFQGEIMFINNTGRQGGAIAAYSSDLYFAESNISFIGNSAVNGGAISLKEGAVININDGTHIVFQGNVTDIYGGGIYIEDGNFLVRRKIKCFVHISGKDVSATFENNAAGIAGAALFGGWIDLCAVNNGVNPSNVFEFKRENSVASNPTRVCMCTNSIINRYKTEVHINVFPGQTFEIEAAAVGQRFGMIPASVRAETARNNIIDQLQKLQDTESQCTKLKYTVRPSNRNELMLLSIDGQTVTVPQWINETIPEEFLQLKVFIILEDCPLGFELDSRRKICLCHHYLNAQGVQCNVTTYRINRNAQQWIGVLNQAKKTIVVHQHCPYDYCKPCALFLSLSTPDEQCSSNRSGILCGACQPGLSQMLGTSNCKKCSNAWLLLIIIFALAGLALVAGLIKLNITVSMGTINGLIFYANIIRANTAAFFPEKMTNTFLSWFIAWLNLDVGIETCFYDGLDAYTKTWLQFIFPLYIWLLITLIIISSKYSQRAARLFGVNAVPVLATLFLVSYAKLLRVTITVFQPTHLLDNHSVWHYDGNITYLGKRHALLVVVALLFFVFFLLPYTLILFGIQWLQIFSHYKLFRWVNKLKPLFDAYTGPYKDKHRYWTGLLLLARICLFVVFSTNTSGDPAINFFAIITVIICLFVYLAMFGGVYKIWLINVLEYSLLLNLVILSVVMLYTTSVDKQNHVLSQTSVSVTLCTTVLIIACHGLVVILKTVKLDPMVTAIWRIVIQSNKMDNHLPKTTDEVQQHNAIPNPHTTHSVIELKEPLLEY